MSDSGGKISKIERVSRSWGTFPSVPRTLRTIYPESEDNRHYNKDDSIHILVRHHLHGDLFVRLTVTRLPTEYHSGSGISRGRRCPCRYTLRDRILVHESDPPSDR